MCCTEQWQAINRHYWKIGKDNFFRKKKDSQYTELCGNYAGGDNYGYFRDIDSKIEALKIVGLEAKKKIKKIIINKIKNNDD